MKKLIPYNSNNLYMKKYVLFLLVVVTVISCNVRRKDKVADGSITMGKLATSDSTSVQIIDSLYNFGKAVDGEKIAYNFKFKNTGTKPLVIISTRASCGCTVPEKPEQPISPGETGFIKVVFNSKGKVGINEKAITVISNATPAFPTLILKGEITPVK